MNKKKFAFWQYIIPWILLGIVIFFVVSSLDTDRYSSHFKLDTPIVTGEQEYYSEGSIIINPHKEQWLIDMIDRAEERVYVAVYTFTLPGLREALVRAYERGVDVRVILEKNPYNAASINRDTINFFIQNNVSYHLSDESQFAFMHAKYMVIDNDWIIETNNWTRSSFASNREIAIVGDDDSILEDLKQLFLADFAGNKGVIHDIRVLAGPTNVRERLIDFVHNTSKELSVYAPSLYDEGLIAALDDVCMSNISVRIIIALYDDTDMNSLHYPDCLEIRGIKTPTLHAKSLIREDAAFIGSFNYTSNSLENNREVGIFVQWLAREQLQKVFDSDWKKSVAIK